MASDLLAPINVIVPLVGAFFIDIENTLVIQGFLAAM